MLVASEATALVEDLQRQNIDRLRQQWRNLSGRKAAPGLTRALLIRLIAHQRQVACHGDLSRETERLLLQIAAKNADGHRASASASVKVAEAFRSVGADRKYQPGTILVREWQGTLHRVTVMKDGFAWNGAVYRSLSKVAREITGSSWNGHVFFGGTDRGLTARRQRLGRSKVEHSLRSGAPS